jgi:RNA polymerase sigma-70 factor, ECF subfamily
VGDAEHEALLGAAANEVMAVVARLSPDQRDVLLLRVIGDLTVDETASALGKSPGAVKQLQRRALAALKREISEEAITP